MTLFLTLCKPYGLRGVDGRNERSPYVYRD